MSKLKIPIIIIVVLVLGFVAYSYFFVGSSDTSTGLKDVSSGDVNNSSDTNPSLMTSEESDTYVKQLTALRVINFNFDIFSDEAYKILRVADTDIPLQPKGRHNPFAPVGDNGGNAVIVPATETQNLPPANLPSASSSIRFTVPLRK